MYFPCSENKGADQLHGYREADLICVFVFAYADCWFSHEEANIFPWGPISYNGHYIIKRNTLKAGF